MLDVAPGGGGQDPGRPPAGTGGAGLPPVPARAGCVQGGPRRGGRHPVGQRGLPAGRDRPPGWDAGGDRARPRTRWRPGGCRTGRSSWSGSSTWPIRPARPAMCTRCGPTPTCRPGTPATPPRRSSPRSNGSPRACGAGSGRGYPGPRRSWPRTTATTSAGTSPPGPTTCASSCCDPGPRSTRTAPASRASTCARPRPHPAPGCTGCAATTRPAPPCAASASRPLPPIKGSMVAIWRSTHDHRPLIGAWEGAEDHGGVDLVVAGRARVQAGGPDRGQGERAPGPRRTRRAGARREPASPARRR